MQTDTHNVSAIHIMTCWRKRKEFQINNLATELSNKDTEIISEIELSEDLFHELCMVTSWTDDY